MIPDRKEVKKSIDKPSAKCKHEAYPHLVCVHCGKLVDDKYAVDKPSIGGKLTKEEFHAILSEFPPSIAEDSGQPEWTVGEIDRLWNFLIGRNRWIERTGGVSE